jgi:hypothetical protein
LPISTNGNGHRSGQSAVADTVEAHDLVLEKSLLAQLAEQFDSETIAAAALRIAFRNVLNEVTHDPLAESMSVANQNFEPRNSVSNSGSARSSAMNRDNVRFDYRHWSRSRRSSR